MSFTGIVKSEISQRLPLETEAISELSAIVRNIGKYDGNNITITTENEDVARHISKVMKDTYDLRFRISVRRGYNFDKNYLYVLTLHQKNQLLLTDLGLIENGKILIIPPEYIVADDDLVRAYLRGLFLAIGSINDPKKSRYHLEFVVNDKEYAFFVSDLLNQLRFNSKVLKRKNKYMIYMKESEKIGDFLRFMEASAAVLYYEDIRIYRDHVNMTNRLNNCEQANVDKTIQSANDQLRDILFLKEVGALELLDEKVKEAALYREKYTEVSLVELSQIITMETGHTITKSGLHHRLKKIKDLANKIREKQEK